MSKIMQEKLRRLLGQQGISDVGFAEVPDGPGGLNYAVVLVARLSDAILREITDLPTHTYFHHYRTVNTFLDQSALQAGLFLQQHGYEFLTVAASQSINNGSPYEGRYSHKKAACLAGLGWVGKNNLFFHQQFGSKVRLATVFTNCAFECSSVPLSCQCGSCNLCAVSCPAHAISGALPTPEMHCETLFDPEKCSRYMKQHFQHIGRGAVCGICMRICPKNKL